MLPKVRWAPTGEQVRENSSPHEARVGVGKEAVDCSELQPIRAEASSPPAAFSAVAGASDDGTVPGRTDALIARSIDSCFNVGR